jgi:hypothetical protein
MYHKQISFEVKKRGFFLSVNLCFSVIVVVLSVGGAVVGTSPLIFQTTILLENNGELENNFWKTIESRLYVLLHGGRFEPTQKVFLKFCYCFTVLFFPAQNQVDLVETRKNPTAKHKKKSISITFF